MNFQAKIKFNYKLLTNLIINVTVTDGLIDTSFSDIETDRPSIIHLVSRFSFPMLDGPPFKTTHFNIALSPTNKLIVSNDSPLGPKSSTGGPKLKIFYF